mmetsp:Transcript_24068/g.39552  ORF Transcript_24068/g.39552 Transcript_24068/m.39552 type:complete len:406 (-) Transcript_24068:675-1892(-)
MALSNYVAEVKECIETRNGEAFADMLTSQHPLKKEILNQLRSNPNLNVESICNARLPDAYAEMISSHIRAVQCLANEDYVEAYANQATLVLAYQRAAQNEDNWSLSVLHKIDFDLRKIAEMADQELIEKGSKPSKLNDAPRILQKSFQLCATDRNSLKESKKLGALAVVNCLFKIYFKLNTLRLCKNLIRAVDGAGFPPFEVFPIAQKVTYKFFVGRLAMYEDSYKKAETDLMYAFENCTKSSYKNKRLILLYLVPVRLVMGYIPSARLLTKYNLPQYQRVAESIRIGNLLEFNDSMAEHHELFVRHGVFLILERAKVIVYRNLFKQTIKISGTVRIPLSVVATVLQLMGEDMPVDEIECILCNLIYQGFIKGYISHQKSFLVVSRSNAFPNIFSLLGRSGPTQS